jgi:hypothetical protein
MRELIVIDGYNFIFRYYKSKNNKNGELELLRDKLVENLVEYKNQTGFDIVVVFDSHMSKNKAKSSLKYKGIEIIYSGERKSADDVIEKIAFLKSGYDRKYIVTSDNIQQTVIFKENIYRKSIREFYSEIKARKKETRSKIENSNKKQSAFGFLSIEKRLKKDQREEILKIKK